MKYAIIFAVIIMIAACSVVHIEYGTPDFNSPQAVAEWVYTNIKPLAEPPNSDFWQYPEETLLLGTGDCEDYAILCLALIYNDFGEKGEVWEEWFPNDPYTLEDDEYHFVPVWEDQPLELWTFDEPHYKVLEITYDNVMAAIKYHRKGAPSASD